MTLTEVNGFSTSHQIRRDKGSLYGTSFQDSFLLDKQMARQLQDDSEIMLQGHCPISAVQTWI